jgi:hypothetical protein
MSDFELSDSLFSAEKKMKRGVDGVIGGVSVSVVLCKRISLTGVFVY